MNVRLALFTCVPPEMGPRGLTSAFQMYDIGSAFAAQSRAHVHQSGFRNGRTIQSMRQTSTKKRADAKQSGMPDRRGGVLDPKGGNETISYERFRRRGSGSYPMKGDPDIYGTRNANCYPMERIRLRAICAWRRRGS